MPHPGVGFPIPPFEWPHVGRQWPPYNIESDQAEGLLAWWPALASHRAPRLRELLRYGQETTAGAGFGWVTDPDLGPCMQFANDDGRVTAIRDYGLTGADTFSTSIWFRPTTIIAATTHDIFDSDDFEGWHECGSFFIYAWGSRQIKAEYRDDTATYRSLTGPGTVVDTLYNAIFVNDPPGTRLYVNGVLADSRAADKVSSTSAIGEMTFGALQDGATPFIGNIGGIRLLDIAVGDALAFSMHHPATRWELHQLPRRLWRLGVVAPPPPTIIPVVMHHYRSMRL